MLIPDGVYNRLPQIWMLIGAGFLLISLAGGPDLRYFWVMLGLGVLCVFRGVQINQSRKSILKKTQIIIPNRTQRLNVKPDPGESS